MISDCSAYDLILVVDDNDDDDDDDRRDSRNTNKSSKIASALTNISCSECMYRFGTQLSSATSTNKNNSTITTTTEVYLVIHDYTNTGKPIRFPICKQYNTIQQQEKQEQQEQQEEEEQQQQQHPIQNTTNNTNNSNNSSHDKIALQQLYHALNVTTATTATIANTDDNDSESCSTYKYYKANYIYVTTSTSNVETILGIAPFYIYVYNQHVIKSKLCIIDVDGTITKSTLSGFYHTAMCSSHDTNPIHLQTHCHMNVCQFFTNLLLQSNNNNKDYTIECIYLTNRPISYVNVTRQLLHNLYETVDHDNNNNSDKTTTTTTTTKSTTGIQKYSTLPKGPIIGFMGSLMGVILMDFYYVNPHVFKYDTLMKYIVQPFLDVVVVVNTTSNNNNNNEKNNNTNPNNDVSSLFYAGFGNTTYDMYAYHKAGIDQQRLFYIDKQSNIYCCCSNNNNESKQVQQNDNNNIHHPKQYEIIIKGNDGTKFVHGYNDPQLMKYMIQLL